MSFPLVVPFQVEGRDNGPIVDMRFVLQGGDRFEIRSTRGGDESTSITHTEGEIGRGGEPAAATPLAELQKLCTQEVPSSAVYGKIDELGLWLGPGFQVAR